MCPSPKLTQGGFTQSGPLRSPEEQLEDAALEGAERQLRRELGEHHTAAAKQAAALLRGSQTRSLAERGGQFGRTITVAGAEGGVMCICGHRHPAHEKGRGRCFYDDCGCSEFFEKRTSVLNKKGP